MLSETTRKIFLIVDRLRAHEAKKVEAWAAEHRDRIELFFLPRYAPERNADEYLNNDMKGSINATGLPGSQEGLRPRIQGFMIKLRHLPEHVRQYFQHPCVKYCTFPELSASCDSAHEALNEPADFWAQAPY